MAGRTRFQSDVFQEEAVDDDISFRNPKRILFDEDVTNKTDVDLTEHMKCYLRIRPFAEGEVANNEDQKCLSVEDDHTVATHAPKESHTYKNCTHGLGKTTHKFKFSHIFDDATTQKDFFNDTMLGLVKDFIDGQNCLVFTYGVTSSGKTYTIQGKPKDAGILPRALDVLFNSIKGKQWPNNILKPKMFMDVTRLTAEQSAEEMKIKERTLKMVTFDEPDVMSLLGDDASDMSQITNTTTCSESSNASYAATGRASKDSLDDVFSDIENRVREETAVCVEDQGLIKFSVWISFAEIYNEQIFDLLEPIPKKKTTRRPVLRLSDDRNGSPYIRGLKEIHVTSADEAYNLLTVGQKNLRTACTKLNHQSSRSHCIFNIKILRVVDKGIPNHARVSMLSLCDLAGSERHSKTQSKGERLKEAGNINTSLMTLGRCIEILRNNQHHKDRTQLIPFRDSKLTRLFQNFFCGRGKAAMIVNVNQCASMFDETLHVFKFSAVAKQVVVVQKPDPPPKKRLKSAPPPKQVPRPSIPWATPGAADVSLMRSALKRGQAIPLPGEDEDMESDSDSMDDSEAAELVRIIESLRHKLREERRSKLIQERDIREEVCQEMMQQIVKIENDYEEQLREREVLAEEMMEKRIKIITDSIATNPRKRARKDVVEDEDDEWVSSILLHQEKVKVQNKEEELKNFVAKNTSLQFKVAHTEKLLDQAEKVGREAEKEVKQLKEKLDHLMSEALGKRKESEVDLGSSCLLETLTQQLQQAKDQIKEQEEEIKELNAMLSEAGETFQQREEEISQLKGVINEDEDKLKQQEIMIRELQTAVEESKKVVDSTEERLVRKDERIIKLEAENQGESVTEIDVQPGMSMCLSDDLKNQKNCNKFLEGTLNQKDEEIKGWKNKFAREEEESFKREQALIHGYKAEINNLKIQLHQLKSNSKVCSPLKESPSKKHRDIESPSKKMRFDSPSRCDKEMESPRKNRMDSPLKKKNVMVDSPISLGSSQHFKEDLSRQIKELQSEFMKNSSATAELESALQIARLTAEDLESRLKSEEKFRQEATVKVNELTADLKEFVELKLKFEEETAERKRYEAEVHQLKSEMKDLENGQCSLMELKNNCEDHEKNLATKVEENLIAESKITTLEANIVELGKEKQNLLEGLASSQSKITDLQNELEKMNDSNKEITEVGNKLTVNLQECERELKEKSESLNSMKDKVLQQEKDVVDKREENTRLTEKLEEAETVNASLREMVNQTTSHIQEKETEIKEIIVENLQSCDSPDPLTNLRKKMRDLKQECEKQKNETTHKSEENENLKKQLEKIHLSKSELDCELKKVSENCKDLEFQLEEKAIELTDMIECRVTLESKINELECKNKELESVSKEKTGQLIELNDEMNKMKVAREMLEEDVRDLEEEREELQTAVETNSELRKEIEDVGRACEGKENELKEIEYKMKNLQKICDEQEVDIDKLKDQITKLESGEISKEESLKQTMSHLKEHVEILTKEITDKETNLSEIIKQSQEEKSSLENQVQSLRQELDNKENLLDEGNRRFEEVQNQVMENQDKLDQVQTEHESVKDRCVYLENKCKETLEKLSDLEKQVQHEGMSVCQENKELKEQVAIVTNDKEEVEIEKDKLNVKCDELENMISELRKQCEESEDRSKTLQQQILELRKKCEESEGRSETLQQQILDLGKQCEESEGRNETLQHDIKNIDHEKVLIQEQVDKLKGKCAEIDKVQLRTQSESSDHNSLSEAKLQIAELKSSLHMHKTLHDKVKNETVEKDEMISQLQQEVEKFKLCDKDVLKSNNDKGLTTQCHKCEAEKEKPACSCDNLRLELDQSKAKIEKLKEELNNFEKERNSCSNKQSKKEIEKLSKACTQQEMLIREQNLKIKKLDNCSKERQAFLDEIDSLEKENLGQKSELNEYKVQQEILEQEVKNLNEAVSQQQKIISRQSEKISGLKQCDSTENLRHEIDHLKSKLSKTEQELVKINHELSSKEQIILSLRENLNQFRENECLSPTSQSNCARKLRKDKIEIENQLIEAKHRIKQLEGEVQGGMLSSPRRIVQVEQLQKAGITSPTVHRELNRSQEREQNLRSQLQQASLTMKQQNEKISELEKSLLETSKRLREAEDSLKQRQSLYGLPKEESNNELKKLKEEHGKRWEIIQNLEKDLQKKETKIQGKTKAIADLKQTMEVEREKFETALQDANANEKMIESLKNAISLQEETMEQQDLYIQQKEETINKLQQDVEKYTDKYHQLLTTSGDSGREIREMTRDNARQSAEVEQLKRTLEDTRNKLEKATDEKLSIAGQIKEKSDELNKMESILKQKSEECENLKSKNCSKVDNSNLVEELRRNIQKLTDDKLMLTSVIKENNDELKEMEKVLSERRNECEELKQQNNTAKLESMKLKIQDNERMIADMKNKLRDRDHSLRDSHKETKRLNDELNKVQKEFEAFKTMIQEKKHADSEFNKQIHHKNEEIIKLQREVEDKSKELGNWKLERDKLVHGLENIMKKQQKEISDLKRQKSDMEERLPQQTTERCTHRSATQHEKVIRISDSTEEVLIKQEVQEEFKSPPRKSSSRRGRKRKSPTLEIPDNDMPTTTKKELTDDNITFVSEDGDISTRIEIDATPAIAAKTLRKSRKKRSSVDLLREEKCDKENKKSTRGRKAKVTKTTNTPETKGISRIMSAIKESPITRSAKKFLEDITEVTPNKDSDSMVEIEDHGTQMSPCVEVISKSRTSRKKHALYKDSLQISEPLDCGSFVANNDDDVHTTVQRKLRGRRK